jgi:hypothetical protein
MIFDIVKFYIFNNILDQTLSNLTLINSRMHDKKGQREYESVSDKTWISTAVQNECGRRRSKMQRCVFVACACVVQLLA